MTQDPTLLSNLTLILTAFAGAFLVALWIALVVWTWRDINNRHRDRLVHILAAILVALLNLPGVLVYLVLRPVRSLEEEYQRTLEEEALLQTIENQNACPGCERRIKDDWVVCPSCQTKLKKTCHHCGKLMDLPWNICPYCTTPAPGMRKESASMDDALRSLPAETVLESGTADLSSDLPDDFTPLSAVTGQEPIIRSDDGDSEIPEQPIAR